MRASCLALRYLLFVLKKVFLVHNGHQWSLFHSSWLTFEILLPVCFVTSCLSFTGSCCYLSGSRCLSERGSHLLHSFHSVFIISCLFLLTSCLCFLTSCLCLLTSSLSSWTSYDGLSTSFVCLLQLPVCPGMLFYFNVTFCVTSTFHDTTFSLFFVSKELPFCVQYLLVRSKDLSVSIKMAKQQPITDQHLRMFETSSSFHRNWITDWS